MARELGLRTVGEGIETAAEAAWLAGRGCALGQGYHFGRPMPLADLVKTMSRSAERDADVRFLPHVVAETSLSAERR
ncbi:MAG: EAL domain-containing protein [Nocardioidaceae bacterium]|nr:EAL domain-containing protein [Nocardioidaceae bacterium]